MDPMEYLRARDIEEPLPWDHIKVGHLRIFFCSKEKKVERDS